MNFIDFISQPWHWSVSGLMIALVMFLLIYSGQRFGVSSSFRALCSVAGAGRIADYFAYDWRRHDWLLVFALGTVIGGGIGVGWLASPEPVQISAATTMDLEAIGVQVPETTAEGRGFLPMELFNFRMLGSLKGIMLMIVGGFLVGFGTRYAGGCTSGHAITGLSNLQLPSLVAVVGFFIGGLVTTFILLPYILTL